jgi:exopolyphosphatase/guanosine-5'-triphosphate,3'-diphosphate pyrophosphatase
VSVTTRDHVNVLPPLACIDIGSNTTRLLVAEPCAGGLTELATQRAYTRLGADLRKGGAISPLRLVSTADVVAHQVRRARELGVTALRAVATAAIRTAPNGDMLVTLARERAGVAVEILPGKEEARLAFVGVTRLLSQTVPGEVAVVDVGGGSTEVALGACDGGVRWSTSLPIGSGLLADTYLHEDPPSPGELLALRAHAQEATATLRHANPALAIAVGGSATSLSRLVGGSLTPEAMDQALALLATTPIEVVAARYGLEPERVRLLPAGLAILAAVAGTLDAPLRIARGGLREGVILELAEAGN